MLASEAPQMMPTVRPIIRNLALLNANSVMRSHQRKAAFCFLLSDSAWLNAATGHTTRNRN